MVKISCCILSLAAACTDFENPEVVIDMRVLAMRADPPEIVTPFDPANPTEIVVEELGRVEVCALVADPKEDRRLAYTMTLCRPTSSGRCRGGVTEFVLGGGEVEDPETAAPPVAMCGAIEPNADLLTVLMEALRSDNYAGFGGLSVQIELEVGPVGGGEAETLHAFKRVLYAPRLPAERVANTNPSLEGIAGLRRATGERGLDFQLPIGRCGEVEPFVVTPRERVQLLPEEPAGVREAYVVPTFDGGSRGFTENLTYQWLSSEGSWSPFESGGEIDVAGNEPPIDSTWTAPSDPAVVGDGLDVRVWMVQRDERGGQAWYESCARVVP